MEKFDIVDMTQFFDI